MEIGLDHQQGMLFSSFENARNIAENFNSQKKNNYTKKNYTNFP